MKTPEDEAWEEMERKQGGGFPAKRAAAADKLKEPTQEPYCYVDPVHLAALNTHQSALVTLQKNPSGYASRGLYTTPPKRDRVLFPTMLRKMWSGSEVQAWLDENVNKEKNNG